MSWFKRKPRQRKDYRISVKEDDPTEEWEYVITIDDYVSDWDIGYWHREYRTSDTKTKWYADNLLYSTYIAEACEAIEFLRKRDAARRNTKVVVCR